MALHCDYVAGHISCQMIARGELPLDKGMTAFVEQFAAKMSFEYNGEVLQIRVVELEIAKKYPVIDVEIFSQYAKKIRKRLTEKFENTDDFRRNIFTKKDVF